MLVFVFDMNRVMGSHKPNKGTLWLVKRLALKVHHIDIMYCIKIVGAQRQDCIWKLQNSFWNQHLHGLDCLNNMNTDSSLREITTDPIKKNLQK